MVFACALTFPRVALDALRPHAGQVTLPACRARLPRRYLSELSVWVGCSHWNNISFIGEGRKVFD